MLYALICTDKPGEGLEIRKATREKHLAYLDSLGDMLAFAGPFMSDDGSTPTGSLVVVRTETLAEAQALADGDPYAQAGVFENVEIRPWKWLIKAPEGEA